MAAKSKGEAPELIRQCRVALGLTQADFGKRLGVSKRTIIRWEQATSFATSYHLVEAAELVAAKAPALADQMRSLSAAMERAWGNEPLRIVDGIVRGPTPEELATREVVGILAQAFRSTPQLARPALAAALLGARIRGLSLDTLLSELQRQR